MKANLFQLVASSVVLGLMGGAVGLHWHRLQGLQVETAPDAATERYTLISAGLSGGLDTLGSGSSLDEAVYRNQELVGEDNAEMAATVAALSEIVSVLKELKEENRDLRDQIEEANRDQDEMRFQLETHSREFRPLNLGTPAARRVDTEENHPLLPPKRD